MSETTQDKITFHAKITKIKRSFKDKKGVRHTNWHWYFTIPYNEREMIDDGNKFLKVTVEKI